MGDRLALNIRRILLYLLCGVLAVLVLGALTGVLLVSLNGWQAGASFQFKVTPSTLFGREQLVYGVIELALLVALYVVYRFSLPTESTNRLLRGNADADRVEVALRPATSARSTSSGKWT